MNDLDAAAPISPLRRRLIDDMTMRRLSRETQRNYIRDVVRFATFRGRSPGTASAEEFPQATDPLSASGTTSASEQAEGTWNGRRGREAA